MKYGVFKDLPELKPLTINELKIFVEVGYFKKVIGLPLYEACENKAIVFL